MIINSGEMRPLRWIAHLPIALLPFLAAVVLETTPFQRSLLAAAELRLSQAGQGWSRVVISGRDAQLRGSAPSEADAAAALAIVAATPGIRQVERRLRVLAP